ncbi:hypothetical protein [Streptomyces sp. NPDC004579]|uniref:DNA polymerase Y family protein n=1 Tax=Streptomyces sp. NPDC004579 TaxID=3154667 RepID=UPI0033A93BB7
MSDIEQATVVHVRCPDRLADEAYRRVLELLADVSPVVQAIPPGAALVELKGVLRYHQLGPQRLGELIRVRSVARLGVDLRLGIGSSIAVAATASAQVRGPGGVLLVAPHETADWLGPLPVEALHGIGPRQGQILRDFGVHCVGLLATIPPATVQRLLGGRAGRQAAERARGIDPRPVVARELPISASVHHAFTNRHELDGAPVRATLLDLVVRLAALLRSRGQVARALTLTLAFAGGTRWETTRRLPEASAHDEDLRVLAYRAMDAAGLQRARLVSLALRGEDLVAADAVAEQISLDDRRENRLLAEGVMDRVRERFGFDAIGPAATLGKVS